MRSPPGLKVKNAPPGAVAQRGKMATVLGVPEVEVTVASGRSQGPPIGGIFRDVIIFLYRTCLILARDRQDAPAGPEVPDPEQAACRGRDEAASVWAESGAVNFTCLMKRRSRS